MLNKSHRSVVSTCVLMFLPYLKKKNTIRFFFFFASLIITDVSGQVVESIITDSVGQAVCSLTSAQQVGDNKYHRSVK